MIRFFRQIRQSLLSDHKFSKYVLYAVGEILLVVIGILIALWVNDWNEGRKDQDKRTALLASLSVEFNANLKQLDSVMYYNSRVIEAANKIVTLRPDQAIPPVYDTLREWVANTTWLWTYNPQNGALRSGISSGDVHLIKNDSLINLLFSWQDVVADAGENEKRHIEVQLRAGSIVNPYVRSLSSSGLSYYDLPESDFPSDFHGLMLDPLFEDYIAEVYIHTFDAQDELKLVRQQNVKIIQILERELNRFK